MIPFNSPHQIPKSFLSHSLAFALKLLPCFKLAAAPIPCSAICSLRLFTPCLERFLDRFPFFTACSSHFASHALWRATIMHAVCHASARTRLPHRTIVPNDGIRDVAFLVMTVRQVWMGRTPTSPPFPQVFPPSPLPNRAQILLVH